ncbi:global transcription factor group B1 [Actinidia rufa]|uniref:Global transcription factor group B1 n=1 Tax=Actinidia rufa TaxID=165716 RepID=A0A7J0FAD6_9ERIC|nr:global transcription factor group B1 [Actinidia rufa]
MTPQRAEDLVFVHSNLRLLSRRSPQYCNGETKMWDIAGDQFGSLEDVGMLEVANRSLDEPELEVVVFTDDGDVEGINSEVEVTEVGSTIFIEKSEKNYVLDEDDYELLQDNDITGCHRREQKVKAAEKISEGHGWRGFSDEECVGSGKSGPTDEEKLKRSLFGDDEGPSLEDIAEEDEQPEEEDIGDEDDMADFIVNEEVDEHGAPVRLCKQGLAKMGKYDSSGEWRERRLEDEFKPIVLSEKYMIEKDIHTRKEDIPERMQVTLCTLKIMLSFKHAAYML